MDSPHLSLNGIRRLATLTDNFYDTDITVECYFPDIPKAIALEDDELYADIWDGYECLPVIISTSYSPWAWSSYDYNNCAIIQIRKAMFCRRGHGILIIKTSQKLWSKIVTFNPRPTNFFEPKQISTRHIPIISHPYFNQEDGIYRSTIRVLVTYKSKLHDPYFKYWSNQDTMLVVDLQDEGTEIRAYAGGDIAVELYDKLIEGRIYYMKNFRFMYNSQAQAYYYNLPDYEYMGDMRVLKLINSTYIEECTGNDLLPKLDLRFNFVPIPRVHREHTGPSIDVLGIIRDIFPIEQRQTWFTIETGITTPYRKITIIDQSGFILPVILWTYNALEFEHERGTIVALRHTTISENVLAGAPLNVLTTSTIHVEPDVEECHALRKWFDTSAGGDVYRIYEQRTICDTQSF